MRMHIVMDDALVEELDAVVGKGHRTEFVVDAVRRALDLARRRDLLRATAGSIADHGHEWDEDPAGWVRSQRSADPRRVG